MPRVVLLGPQRFDPTVREVIDAMGIDGSIAVITAGWQEREAENQELRDHVGRPVLDLMLYQRYDEVQAREHALARTLEERQNVLQRHQELYRLRLHHTLVPALELMRSPERSLALAHHRKAAVRALRMLDRQHLAVLRRIHEDFEVRSKTASAPTVARHREQLARILDRCQALAIAGGHVAVLLNRMRLFGLAELLGDRPVVAWSAGAMAVSERVVLFHDRPPQGAGDPEVFDAGLGLCRGVLPLPHARRRLDLDDPVRVALFARRFHPSVAVAFDPGAHLAWNGSSWTAGPSTVYLGRGGRVQAMEA